MQVANIACRDGVTKANKRILIADDHPMVRRGVRALVETRPQYSVVAEAGDGRSAIHEARSSRPDIAIVDCSLAFLNGIDLTLILKQELPQLEVLMFTIHDREEIVLQAIEAGVRSFILKSDAEVQLLAALDALSNGLPYFSGIVSEILLRQQLGIADRADRYLTRREREVVQLIAEGRTNKEIAHILGTSIKTVETHRAKVMQKLKVDSLAGVVRYALRHRMVAA